MNDIETIKRLIKDNKEKLRADFNVRLIGIFGSYIRGDQSVTSDLDILIDYDHRRKFSLFDLIDLENYLTELTGVKVDLALKRKLKPVIGSYILKEVVYL